MTNPADMKNLSQEDRQAWFWCEWVEDCIQLILDNPTNTADLLEDMRERVRGCKAKIGHKG